MSRIPGPASISINIPKKAGWEPVNLSEYEHFAAENLPKNAFDYYASGANDMVTLRENRSAFSDLYILPRILQDVSNINRSTSILGETVQSPICIAPTAMQKMAHPDGEIATVRAAASSGTLVTLSSWATTSLEDVANAAPTSVRWFQLYVYKDRKLTEELVRRAEANGYRAIAVTVDTPVLGRRESDIRNRFKLPSHLSMANFVKQGGELAEGTKDGGQDSGLASYVASLIDKSLNWEDIRWLRNLTHLKIVVKGILTVEDALIALNHGVDGIWISNHGARQLDTSPPTIFVLNQIVRAVNNKVEVYIDGGFMRGTDIFKALALGAKAVFIGRPILWGLAHSGEKGVEHILELLNCELEMAMQLTGCQNMSDITSRTIIHRQQFISRL